VVARRRDGTESVPYKRKCRFYVGAQFIEPEDNGFDESNPTLIADDQNRYSGSSLTPREDRFCPDKSGLPVRGFSTLSESTPYKRKCRFYVGAQFIEPVYYRGF
jgi:hypothetical protein